MIVINSIKRSIQIPNISIVDDGIGNITIGAIDKVLYSKFLALSPKIILCNDELVDGYAEQSGVRLVEYTGDEILSSVQGYLEWYAISVKDNIIL